MTETESEMTEDIINGDDPRVPEVCDHYNVTDRLLHVPTNIIFVNGLPFIKGQDGRFHRLTPEEFKAYQPDFFDGRTAYEGEG